jgi:hypothetical protein
MLFPLSEPSFFCLNLLREPLPELLFFLFEFGIVKLLDLGFPELPGLHLLLTIVFVMAFFRRRNEVKHVRPDEQRSKLSEIAVILVFN